MIERGGDHLASWLLFIEERVLAVALTEFQGDERHSGRAHGFVESWAWLPSLVVHADFFV
jgi:hypothetical protein